eukprot:g4545.t1
MSGEILLIAFLLVGIAGEVHGELDVGRQSVDTMKIEGNTNEDKQQSFDKDLVQKPNMTYAVPLGVRFRRALESTEIIPSKQQELTTRRKDVFLIRLASNDIKTLEHPDEFFLSLEPVGIKSDRKNDELGMTKAYFFRTEAQTASKWSKVKGTTRNAFYLELLQSNAQQSRYLAAQDDQFSQRKSSTPSLGLVSDLSKAIEWRIVQVDEQLLFLLVVRDHSSNTGAGATGLFLATLEDELDNSESSNGLNLALRSYFPVGVEFIMTTT